MLHQDDGTPLRIRDANAADMAAIRDLTLEAYGEYGAVMAPEAWKGLYSAVRRGLAADAVAERIVAEREGEIVGSVMLYPQGSDAYSGATPPLQWPEVRLLAVSPAARGQGIGAALMEECIRRARNAGASRLGLHTSKSMSAAVELYRKMGFKRFPQHDFHPPGGETVEAHILDLTDSGDTGSS